MLKVLLYIEKKNSEERENRQRKGKYIGVTEDQSLK